MNTQNFGKNKNSSCFSGSDIWICPNPDIMRMITPRHQEQKPWIRVKEEECSKGKYYTIFHIRILFRDLQITSIWSYSGKKKTTVFWKWQTIWEWGQSFSKTTFSTSVGLFITQWCESNTNISVDSVSVCWEHGLFCRRPDYQQI